MNELFGAVVLTMDKKDIAKECIKSLIKQNLSKIIVIDNGSRDGTSKDLRFVFKKEIQNKKIKIITLNKNLGSAGGYSKGISESIKEGIDWIWLFDDDCEALPESLIKLKKAKSILEKKGEKISFLTSRQNLLDNGFFPVCINSKGSGYLKYLDKTLIELRWTVYTGTLLNANVVKRVGLPIEELFLYDDDTEFTYRLRKDHKGFLVGNSNILHKEYFFKRKNFISKDKKLIHRQKYAIRNGVFFSKILFQKNKIEGIVYLISIFKNIFINTFFSKNFLYSFKLLEYFLKGFIFNPKISHRRE